MHSEHNQVITSTKAFPRREKTKFAALRPQTGVPISNRHFQSKKFHARNESGVSNSLMCAGRTDGFSKVHHKISSDVVSTKMSEQVHSANQKSFPRMDSIHSIKEKRVMSSKISRGMSMH